MFLAKTAISFDEIKSASDGDRDRNKFRLLEDFDYKRRTNSPPTLEYNDLRRDLNYVVLLYFYSIQLI